MSILVRFTGASGMTSEKYDQTMPTIEASGEFPPDGLDYHVAFSAGGSFRVTRSGTRGSSSRRSVSA
jgi:hypothetical protein